MNTDKKFVLGIIGEIGAGKGTLIRSLEKLVLTPAAPYRWVHAATVEPLKKALDLKHLPHTRENLQNAALDMEKALGAGAISRHMKWRIDNSSGIIAYDCIRWGSDLEVVKSFPDLVVYVTAPQQVRWERCKARKEKDGEAFMTFEEFQACESKPTESSISWLGTQADFTLFNGEESFEKCESAIKQLLQFYLKPRLAKIWH